MKQRTKTTPETVQAEGLKFNVHTVFLIAAIIISTLVSITAIRSDIETQLKVDHTILEDIKEHVEDLEVEIDDLKKHVKNAELSIVRIEERIKKNGGVE